MAGARVERVGSIFKRIEGLYKGKALKKEELPLWFDIYKAFPPHVEPTLSRPKPTTVVRNIVFLQDFILRDYLNDFKYPKNPWNFLESGKAKPHRLQRYVDAYIKQASKNKTIDARKIRNEAHQDAKRSS